MCPRTVLSLAALAAAALLTANALAGTTRSAVQGNPTQGKALFLRAGIFCSSCHTLKAAKSTGRDGPNLDKAKPSYAKVVEFVTKGSSPTRRWPTGMPGYARELTKARIDDIAAFVFVATRG